MTTQRRLLYASDAGPTHVKVHVEIDSKGDLVLAGHDVGAAPLQASGDADLEYFLRVPAAQKDRLLLDLVAHAFSTATACSDLKEWLKGRGVPCSFETW